MRRILEFLIGVVVCMMALHTFVAMGVVAPVQVSAGSMAPHWFGPHWDLVCPNCGADYEVGAEAPPQAGRTACPACGAMVLIGDAPRQEGDFVLVDRTAFHIRSPRRWEAVVFRCPGDAKRLCVKRVIGLPGERISLVDGDVFVNGRLSRKSLDEQRALSVLVYGGGPSYSRWRPVAESSSWRFHSDFSPTFEFDPDNEPRPERPLDLLNYTSPGRQPTSDALSYNAGAPAVVNPTADLMLTGRFNVTGSGALLVRCGDGFGAHWVEVDLADGVVRLRRANQLIREAASPLHVQSQGDRRDFDFELSLFDRQITVAVDGHQVLRHPLAVCMPPSATPFAIAATGMKIRIEDLAILRDVLYTPRPGGSVVSVPVGTTWQLAAGEYFVLGDNPAISDDSRTWPGGPGLPAKLIVGRAMGTR